MPSWNARTVRDQALAAYMAAGKEEAEKRQRHAMSSIEQGEHDEEMQAVDDLLNGMDATK